MKARNLIILIIISCLLAAVAALIASKYPDGLEWVAERLNFLERGKGKEIIKSPEGAVIGVIVTFLIAYLLGKLLSRKK